MRLTGTTKTFLNLIESVKVLINCPNSIFARRKTVFYLTSVKPIPLMLLTKMLRAKHAFHKPIKLKLK